jgi:prepilin-type N-terminal cleavage/methylation domain-containing protein
MKRSSSRGFSLIELMTVIGMIAMMAVLLVPGLNSVTRGREAAAAGAEIAGLLEQARAYAMAKNTYVWVGFAEEDGTQPSRVPMAPGGGRVVISVVASRNGERYIDDGITPADFGAGGDPVELEPIHRLVRLPGVRLTSANTGGDSGNHPARPAVSAEYQVGDPPNGDPQNESGAFAVSGGSLQFSYPLTGAAQYHFRKIIEFNPRGEASKAGEATLAGPGAPQRIEVAVVPAPGGRVGEPFLTAGWGAAVVQIDGLSGNVRLFQ